MDADYWSLDDLGLIAAFCPNPHCHHRQYFEPVGQQIHIELQCPECGITFYYDLYEEESVANIMEIEPPT
jgi:hypothetical protein